MKAEKYNGYALLYRRCVCAVFTRKIHLFIQKTQNNKHGISYLTNGESGNKGYLAKLS